MVYVYYRYLPASAINCISLMHIFKQRNFNGKIISKLIAIITHYFNVTQYLGSARHLPSEPAHNIELRAKMSYNHY